MSRIGYELKELFNACSSPSISSCVVAQLVTNRQTISLSLFRSQTSKTTFSLSALYCSGVKTTNCWLVGEFTAIGIL